MRKNNGFTLAEVLITLGIIGVVAALTIPTLISNTNSRRFASQFKKSLFLDTVLILIRELIIGLQQNLALTMIFPPYFYNIK